MEANELIVAGEQPQYGPQRSRGRGRPPKIYSLNSSGRDVFEQAYDDLAVSALRFLQDQGGEAAVTAFAQRRAWEMEHRYLPVVSKAATPDERASALVTAMNEDGFAAAITGTSHGPTAIQICQHNCPVAHVAAEFPQLCESETKAFANLLGTHVTRIATIAHGDGVCTAVVTKPLSQVLERTTS